MNANPLAAAIAGEFGMPIVLRQGTLHFVSGYKLQTLWGFREAAIFTLEGVGATTLAGCLLLGWATGVALGVALIAVAVLLLLSHLGHPAKALLALRNVGRSWISNGTAVIGATTLLGALYVALHGLAGLPAGGGWSQAFAWLLVPAALFILVYPGLVLSASPAIPFWSSGLLPVLSLALGLSSGLCTLLALLPPLGVAGAPVEGLGRWALLSLGALAVCLAVYVAVMLQSVAAAYESAWRLLRREALLFWGGGCGLGLALPALLLALTLGGQGPAAPLLALGAAAKLSGDVALRYAIIKVGLFDPVF
ncbi:MAG: polysulfide reductase NrfD [Candidatus Lambdaproteobacteria bacterium]|nr:polysulfide reductase NrfD [Candidatus Lambdaproteobacteria bacterium]